MSAGEAPRWPLERDEGKGADPGDAGDGQGMVTAGRAIDHGVRATIAGPAPAVQTSWITNIKLPHTHGARGENGEAADEQGSRELVSDKAQQMSPKAPGWSPVPPSDWQQPNNTTK